MVREWVRKGAWAKQEFRDSQAYSLRMHQPLRGGCPAVLTPGQYTHHPKCPHLIATLQRVVDEVALSMWTDSAPNGQRPDDDRPSPPFLPPGHGAGYHVPPMQPETASHLWACSAQSHEWGPARRRLAAWLNQKVGPRVAPVRHQLWELVVLEQWAAALRTSAKQLAHLECTGLRALGMEFLRHVIEESIRSGTPTPRRVLRR